RVVSLCLVTLASVSTAMVALSTPASARTHHHHHRMVRHVRAHYAGRYLAYRHYRHVARLSRWDAGVAQMSSGGFANANASIVPYSSGWMVAAPRAKASQRGFTSQTSFASQGSFGSSDLVADARRYIGGNPTGRGSLWCARFMNMVLQQTGHRGTGS